MMLPNNEIWWPRAGARWPIPTFSDPVNGTTIIWMKKPMQPARLDPDTPVDLQGPSFKAFQVHPDYPNILVMPEQYQHNASDKPGQRLKSNAAKDEFLKDVITAIEYVAAGDCGRALLKVLTDAKRITLHPDYEYDQNRGYFTVTDGELGDEVGKRGNVLILGPSESDNVGPNERVGDFAGPRTSFASHNYTGTGAMISTEPKVSISVNDGGEQNIVDYFSVLGHELLHAEAFNLGIHPLDDSYAIKWEVTMGPHKGKRVAIKKAESDVTAIQSRVVRNNGDMLTKECKQALPVLNNALELILKSTVSQAIKEQYAQSFKLRKQHLESSNRTEEIITADSIYALKRLGIIPETKTPIYRDFYQNTDGHCYRRDDPADLMSEWKDEHKVLKSCSIM